MTPIDLIARLHEAARPSDMAALVPVAGSHALASAGEGEQVRSHLRIDPELGVLSGDLFADTGCGHPPSNGDWRFSWQSEAVFSFDDRVAAICTLHADPRFREPLSPGAKVLVAFLPVADRIEDVHVVVLNEATDIRPIPAAYRLRPADADSRRDAFRDIRINLSADFEMENPGTARDRLRARLVADAIEGAGLRSVEAVLADAGIRADMPRRPGPVVVEGARPAPARSLADAVARISPAQFTRDPWQFTIMFSALANSDGAGKSARSIPYGRTFGLATGLSAFRVRSCAIVFVDEIVRAYQRHLNLSDREIASDLHAVRLARRVRYTILHEIGHLLNLPHSWQRDRFAGSDLPANPSDASVLAYGSKYPMGILHDHALRHAARDDGDTALDTAVFEFSLRNMERGLADPGFPPLEQRHIRHAPFLSIGVGETSFLQDPATHRRIERLWHAERRLHLVVDRARPSPCAEDGPIAQSVALAVYPGGTRRNRLEPPTGHVRIRNSALAHACGPSSDPMFGFLGGTLKLLVRPDPPDRREPMRPASELPMPPIPLTGRLDEGYGPVRAQPAPDGDGLVAPLPLIPPAALSDLEGSGRLTLQVVYLGADGTELRSEPLHVNYDSATGALPLPAVAADLLADPLLPLLWEIDGFCRAVGGIARAADFSHLTLPEDDRLGLATLADRILSREAGEAVAERGRADLGWLGRLRDGLRRAADGGETYHPAATWAGTRSDDVSARLRPLTASPHGRRAQAHA